MTKTKRKAAHSREVTQQRGTNGKSAQPKKASQSASTKLKHPTQRAALLILGIILVGLHGVVWTALSLSIYRNSIKIAMPIALTLLLLSSLAAIVAAVAMWMWKKWGFWLFLGAAVVTSALALIASGSLWMFLGSFLQGIIAAYLIYPHLKHFA